MSRQAALASFPSPSYLNEIGVSQAAINGAYLDQTQAARSYSLTAGAAPVAASAQSASLTYRQGSYSLAASPGAVAATPNMATLGKTTAQGTAYSFMATAASLALGGPSAALNKAAAPVASSSTRQAAFASFPMPAYLNEGYGSQRALSGGYIDETPQTQLLKLAAAASAVSVAAPAVTASVHVSNLMLAAGAASAAITPQAAALSKKSAPIVLPPSRYGLGIGITISFLPTVVGGGTNYVLSAGSASLASQVVSAVLLVATAAASGTQPLRVVASGLRLNDSAASGSAGKTQSISRQPVWFGGDTTEARPTFANWYYATTGASTTPPTAITIVKASLEKGDGSITIPLTFSGARSITLQPNDQDIQADPVLPSAFSLTKYSGDSQWWVRCSMLLPSTSGVFPTNIAPGNTIAGARCYIYPPANDIDQVDATGPITTPTNASGAAGAINAVAIVGRYFSDAASRSVMYCTDSIGIGVGDSAPFCPLGSGFAARALSSNGSGTPINVIAAIFASRAGSYITQHMQNTLEMYWFKYVKTLFDEIGTNSLPGSPNNNAFLSQQQSYWSAARQAGVQHIIKAYITPKTTSTDSFASASGQTPTSGRGAGNVPGIDDWDASMRGFVSSGVLDMYVDSPSLRDNNDPHLWFSNGTAGYATGDGLHPAMVMHVAKGADTRVAILSYA